ncbi:uncharacterized protein Pyn_01395 [Prunus yedoensis var. nudiflora]|uniref:Uncharacterized protein n=1 Tax=Prunus yedoensis var. nudiflora TaxID=2094558 RepID=A0A315AAY8_PRUYE|nr:uncharacterized protein Pyn_01395 [Prunus yedoensis var. nudiflora]
MSFRKHILAAAIPILVYMKQFDLKGRAISEIQNDLESAMRSSITPALATTDIADTPPDLVNPSAVELVLDIRREYAKKLEQATRRSITPALATTDIADIPPDLVNPSAVEFGLDIRREYAKKLEQSRERSRKLQSDLAVEEHRGQELSRILKELLPDPKTSNVTNNEVLKLEVLVIGEHDTFRFVREAISRAVLDMFFGNQPGLSLFIRRHPVHGILRCMERPTLLLWTTDLLLSWGEQTEDTCGRMAWEEVGTGG